MDLRPEDDRRALSAEGYPGEYPDDAHPASPRYRAVSKLAVLSLTLGVLSISTVLSWYLSAIPVLGIVLAWLALRRISDFPSELTGKGLAWVGLGLSVGLWAFGGGCLAYSQMKEHPHGYTWISFADLQPDRDDPQVKIPPDIYELQGKKVYLKGFMYPGRQNVGIKQFILVPTIGHCAFCTRKLKSTEMIYVTLAGDLSTRYRTSKVGFGGKLEIDSAQANRPFGGLPYRLEADYVR